MNEITKITESVRKKVLKIMELAMLINDSPTRQELTGNKPTVFIAFSGHCCFLTVYVYPEGWTSDEAIDDKFLCGGLNLSEETAFTPDGQSKEIPTERKLEGVILVLTDILYNIQQKENGGKHNEKINENKAVFETV